MPTVLSLVGLILITTSPMADAGRQSIDITQATASAAIPGTPGQLTSQRCQIESRPHGQPDIVATDAGWLRGARAGQTYVFKGIPYASPPVGARRWQPPAAPDCWSGLRDATEFGSVCPQVGALPGAATTWFGNEDCLTLNVWMPAARGPRDRLPVLFFIHGGGNQRGAGSMNVPTSIPFLGPNIQDGERLSALGHVVVVTINFRLGFLGFLAHPALSRESASRASGNYALMDQIAALRWVQRNIRNFGGDPSRVLLFGQSDGRRNICAILAGGGTASLYSRAAFISGGCENFPDLETAEAYGQNWSANLGCDAPADEAACLRSRPTEQLVTTTVDRPVRLFSASFFRLGPIVDRVLLHDQPNTVFRSRAYRGAPILVTSTANEAAFSLLQQWYRGPIETPTDYQDAVRSLAPPELVSEILVRYPVEGFQTPRAALTELLSDANSICPSRRTSRTLSSASQPVWRAIWMHTASNGPVHPFGPAHVTDLPYWFNTLGGMPDFTPTRSEMALADTMAGYLVAFAATGNPNHRGAPAWPRYDVEKSQELNLDDKISVGAGFRDRFCEFWDEHMPPAGFEDGR